MSNQKMNTRPIFYQDATGIAALIRKREVSPVKVMKAHLDRIETLNPTINAIDTIANHALEAAMAAEAAVMRGNEGG